MSVVIVVLFILAIFGCGAAGEALGAILGCGLFLGVILVIGYVIIYLVGK